MTSIRRIATARLVLEPQVEAHADAMFDLLQDPAIYEHENEPPASREWLRERFRRLESRASGDGREAWLNWIVTMNAEPIGFVQATIAGDASAAIAYVFASRHWGRGFAREAVDALLAELAAYYAVAAVHAVLKRSNARSLRLLQRCGFALDDNPACPNAILPDECLWRRAIAAAPR
jgi:[ribosomal protein S5]-alanine N-acetyltransferase